MRNAYIALWSNRLPVSALIRWRTKQDTSHAGLIVCGDDDDEWFVVHAKYGWYFIKPAVVREPIAKVRRNLKYILCVRQDLFQTPKKYREAVGKVIRLAETYIGKRYDWRSIAGIVLDPIGLGRFIPDSRSRVMCSELVSEVWSSAFPHQDGSVFVSKPHSRVTPGDLKDSPITEEVWCAEPS